MRLWNDYEGKTIAGSFPIDKLIRPEGRSAFFSTTNGTGKPAVIRLIEAINDEDEILERWNTVANLHQDHLITLRKYGHTVMDGTPLIYAVMEPSESDLAAILHERPLTLDETRQVATSLVAALQSLHASNIVHEHVEPSNVLAAGDLVKLRSDCIREAPTGPDGDILKAADIHDLGVVLLQCLTQHRTLAANGNARLPVPFDFIIPNALHGVCTLDQIAATLTPPTPAPAPSQPQLAQPAVPSQQSVSPQPSAPPPYTAATRKPPAKAPHPAQAQLPLLDLEPSQPALDLHSPAAVAAAMPPVVRMPAPRPAASAALDRIRLSIEADPKRKRLWLALAVAAFVLLVALGWHAFSAAPATDPAHAITPITALPTTAASTLHKPSAATNPKAAGKGSAAASNSAAASTSAAASNSTASNNAAANHSPTAATKATAPDTQADWHVVVFTYNHEDQAWQKVAALKRDHNSLHPEVFAPNGHAPFLVTLGGPMTREEAFALRDKARRAGLPRDTYAQNYPKARQ